MSDHDGIVKVDIKSSHDAIVKIDPKPNHDGIVKVDPKSSHDAIVDPAPNRDPVLFVPKFKLSLATTPRFQFIKLAMKRFCNLFTYLNVVYLAGNLPVMVTCPDHGDFAITPDGHLKSVLGGCPRCPLPSSQTLDFINRSRSIYGDLYGYHKTHFRYSYFTVIMVCPVHGDFARVVDSHIKEKKGCRTCAYFETFLVNANARFHNKFDYSQSLYVNKRTQILIICPIHGSFWEFPSDHLDSIHGCYECGVKASNDSKRKSQEDFISQAMAKHEGKNYDYSKVEYIGSETDVIIICPEHGDFPISAGGHLFGRGCQKCSFRQGCDNHAYTTQDFIELANIVHKHDPYDYSLTNYVRCHVPVVVIHNACGQQSIVVPSRHLAGSGGCQNCRFKSEMVCRSILEEITGLKFPKILPKFLRNPLTGHLLELDCYCEPIKFAVEYNDHKVKFPLITDEQHLEQLERDKVKQTLCPENGVTLMYVPTTYTFLKRPAMKNFIIGEMIRLDMSHHILSIHLDEYREQLLKLA